MEIVPRIKDLYNHYWDQVIAWFDSLEQVYQFGVFFLIFVTGFLIVAFFFLSRLTK